MFHGLEAVRGLARGRSEARESEPVKPVPDAFVDAVKPLVAPQVWAMVELQRFTGMRPGEVTKMRTCDLDTSGKVWVYTPSSHKTEWRGHERHIYIGPRAQRVLKPWVRPELDAYPFQLSTTGSGRTPTSRTPQSSEDSAQIWQSSRIEPPSKSKTDGWRVLQGDGIRSRNQPSV